MMPAKSEERDLIKTKGGRNHTILMDHIELTSLRDYQRKEYELQRDDPRFKPTPPRFEPCIPEHKENGTLWEYLVGQLGADRRVAVEVVNALLVGGFADGLSNVVKEHS